MNESDRQLAETIRASMADFGAQHGARSKKLDWWARWSKPLQAALGVLGGSTGAASLFNAFVRDDDGDGQWTFQMGWPQALGVLQGGLLVAAAAIAAQNFELRSIRHNDTAGDCAELINDIDGLLNDTRADESEVIKAMAHFQAKKTEIQQGAPHL